MAKTIRDVMTTMPHSIGIDQKLRVASEMMREHGFRHLPVQHGGKLVGILTHRDLQLVRDWSRDGRSGEDALTVADLYTPEPYTVAPTTALREVAARMARDQIGACLVVDQSKLVGIFTTTDACRVLAEIS